MKGKHVMQERKILVADDDADLVETIRFRLKAEGYEVFIASNGWEALGAVYAVRPELVILDVLLPKENGYRVSATIKQDQQDGKLPKKLHVLLVTGRKIEGDPERAQKLADFSKADGVLYKPFDLEELVKRARALLGDSS